MCSFWSNRGRPNLVICHAGKRSVPTLLTFLFKNWCTSHNRDYFVSPFFALGGLFSHLLRMRFSASRSWCDTLEFTQWNLPAYGQTLGRFSFWMMAHSLKSRKRNRNRLLLPTGMEKVSPGVLEKGRNWKNHSDLIYSVCFRMACWKCLQNQYATVPCNTTNRISEVVFQSLWVQISFRYFQHYTMVFGACALVRTELASRWWSSHAKWFGMFEQTCSHCMFRNFGGTSWFHWCLFISCMGMLNSTPFFLDALSAL